MPNLQAAKIAVIGLGYVGLPLAVEFGKKRPVLGFDTSPERVAELRSGHDRPDETDAAELAEAKGLEFTTDAEELKRCNVFIVAVPTPDGQAVDRITQDMIEWLGC